MPAAGFTISHRNGPILVPADLRGKIEVLARIDRDCVLANGIVRGAQLLNDTPCILRARRGAGDILLYTFNPERRVQQDGTFKLLFNALFLPA